MKFLLDQGLPRSAVDHLANLGLVSEHVADLGMSRATDEFILEFGRSREAIVVTLDSDFHALLAMSNAINPSVIRIRVQGLKGSDVAELVARVVQIAKSELIEGAAVTVTERRLAIRRLPLKA